MSTAITILGGVGLFLLGMTVMTDGLKALAGSALRTVMAKAAATPLSGAFWGAVVTLLVQSSSAVTMTTIGLVNAGLLTFPQGLGLVFGANVGTTGTGWLVALIGVRVSLAAYALPMIFIGALAKLLGSGRVAASGAALAGFALVLYGLATLQQGMGGLAETLHPSDLPEVLGVPGVGWATGLMGLLILIAVGTAMTAVMQSSTAAIAVTISAFYAGAISLEQGAALIIGQNIGTASSSALAAIGASTTAKRLALAYVLFKVIAAIIAVVVFPLTVVLMNRWAASIDGTTLLAAYHTAYNVVGVAVLLPATQWFTRMVERLLPAKETTLQRALDPSVLSNPVIAVETARRVLAEALSTLAASVSAVLSGKAKQPPSGTSSAVTAVNEVRDFLSEIREPPETDAERLRMTSALHALDHISRLAENLERVALPGEQARTLHFERQAELCDRVMRSAQTIGASISSEAAFSEQASPIGWNVSDQVGAALVDAEAAARELALVERDDRAATLARVAPGGLTAADALAQIDSARWIARITHHASRSAAHLLGRGWDDKSQPTFQSETARAKGKEMSSPEAIATDTTLWHTMPANEVEKQLRVDPKVGLDAAEANERLNTYGPNRLPQGKKRGSLMRFAAQFNNILIYVLLVAGFIKLMLSLWLDASIIFAVVILNSLLGFLQEGRAEKALDSIRNMLSAEARVLRGGETRFIAAEELVPGDVVLLESGDKVPADLRLVDAKNLRTEEAALTGESVPAEKTTSPVSAKATVGDRENMAFSGTMVVSGRATGIVVATGSLTELGRINQMLAEVSALETPLLRQIKKFGYVITAAIAVISVLLFAWGHWLGEKSFVELFQAVVGIAVSLIPEGLPALITITLAIGVQRMAQRNAIIRRLPAVETLGSVSRICSDKTGTLTLMEMMVTSVVTADASYEVTGDGYAPEGEVKADGKRIGAVPEVLTLMGRVSVLCNDADLFEDDGKWKVEGDPTEGALYPFATKLGMDRSAEAAAAPRIDTIPFESEHKFMATLNRSAAGDILLVKGAPEVILDHCDRRQTAKGPAPLDRDHFAREGDRLAAQGERVLGLAWLPDPGLDSGSLGPEQLPRNLVLLGLVGLMDPPRKEAVDAVKECHGGGIRVTMITGDHKITAAAIAKMLGIGDGQTAVAGTEIEAMNDAELQECVRDVDVFARASPEHKLRLVKAMQANRQIVAMTGDGVNDAPALKKADIGVAMGIKGTEVTKEAAEMILADDNFASISAAVKEGRTVYNNIEKAMLFLLPTNVAQAAVIAVAILFALTLPITAPQVLWVNMVTSVALGLVISFEPHEGDVMRRPPRAVDRSIVTGFGIWRILFVGAALLVYTLAAFFWMKTEGASDQMARTAAVNAITLGQVFYLLNSRYLLESSLSVRAHMGNPYLWYGIAAVVVLQLLFTYAPPFQAIFDTEGLPLRAWAWLIGGALVFFLVVELEKLIIRSNQSLRAAAACG